MRQEFSFTHFLEIPTEFDCLVGQIELLGKKLENVNSIVFLNKKSF